MDARYFLQGGPFDGEISRALPAEYVLTGRRLLSDGCNGELSVAKWADVEFAALLIEKSTARTAFESLLAVRGLPVDAAIDALPLDMEMRHAVSKFRWAATRYEQWLSR